jgi:hypothetical protein
MLVKNTSNKTIGLGALVILPDEEKTLPKGYGIEHPMVKYLLNKQASKKSKVTMLTVVKGGGKPTPPPAPELTEEEKAAAAAKAETDAKRAELDAKIKAVARMNRDQLNAEADALGVAFDENDNNDVRKQKLTERLQADMAEVG